MRKIQFLITIFLFFSEFCFGQSDSINLNYALFVVSGDSCLYMKNYGCAFYNYNQAKRIKPNNRQITKDMNSIIIKSFGIVDYFSDSTIKCAYKIKKRGYYNGYAVEFDSMGNAIRIGKYKKGEKNGSWQYNNGSVEIYKHGKMNGALTSPCCETDERAAKADFQKLFIKLINENKQK